jgi:hypothetical protein
MVQGKCFSTCINANGTTDQGERGLSELSHAPRCWACRAIHDTFTPRHVRTLSRPCRAVTVVVRVTDTVSDVLT